MTEAPTTQRVVTIAELAKRSSLSVATIYRLMPDQLARPRKITDRRVGWSADYIDDWLNARVGGEQVSA